MPTVNLCVSDPVRPLVESLAKQKGWVVSKDAAVALVERGQLPPETGLAILFGPGLESADAELLGALFFGEAASSAKPYVIAQRGEHFELIEFRHVRYFRADGNEVLAATREGSFGVTQKLYELEQQLRQRGFVRIGKSQIVNVLWIAEIVPWFRGRILLKLKDGNEEVQVARTYARSFKEYLGMGT